MEVRIGRRWVLCLFFESEFGPIPSPNFQADDSAFQKPVKVDEFKFPLTAWPSILFEAVFVPISFLNTPTTIRMRETIGMQFVYRFWKAVLVIHILETSYMLYLCRKHKTSRRIGVSVCAVFISGEFLASSLTADVFHVAFRDVRFVEPILCRSVHRRLPIHYSLPSVGSGDRTEVGTTATKSNKSMTCSFLPLKSFMTSVSGTGLSMLSRP